MRRFTFGLWSFLALFVSIATIATADDSLDQAIEKERKLLEETWRMVYLEIDGNRLPEDDVKKLTITNAADGSWTLQAEGVEISKGDSTIDPTMKIKTVDFTPANGDNAGKQHLGIYELTENSRRLCVAPPGERRPTEFTSNSGSKHLLIMFEREPSK